MSTAPELHIRLSANASSKLIGLKRFTGIKHWNVLCRWAFCTSLAEPTSPSRAQVLPGDVEMDMSWKVFTGPQDEIYLALLKQRCRRDGLELDHETLEDQLRLHVHRGIATLSGARGMRSIEALMERALAGTSQ